MPRIAEIRVPARPNSPQQQERVERILRAAARQGAANGLERVQMHEIAKESGVAIATLYRYFPSKMHLFTSVMKAQIQRIGDALPAADPAVDPVDAVTGVLIMATDQMLRAPLLAHAMMTSNNAAFHATAAEANQTHEAFKSLLFRVAGKDDPTARDDQLFRLVEQAWFGAINSGLNQRTSHAEVEDDIRVSCQLLLAEWSRD